MSTALPPPSAAPGQATALATAWGRTRSRAPRTALMLAVVCTAIAFVVYGFEARGLAYKLLYSFCTGGACLAVIEAGRLLMADLLDAQRRLRHLPPSPCGFESGWRGMLLLLPLAVLLGPHLGTALADTLAGERTPSLFDWSQASTRMTMTLALVGTGAAVFVISGMERLAAARAAAEAAQRAAVENQLRLLQSQLEPHMLFNTLANLRVLIGLDPSRAQAMLDRLIAFLRATLSASRRDTHPLGDEFQHLDDYLALMAIRMGPRLRVQLDLPPELGAVPIPPLLLQPLVENAIKHGLEPKVDGGRIEVRARRAGALLVLTVRDTGLGLDAPAGGGTAFGLEQVRRRLAALFGIHATFELQAAADAEGGALATIQLPWPVAA